VSNLYPLHHSKESILAFGVKSQRTGVILYTVYLTALREEEKTLNAGRFRHFSAVPQANHVTIEKFVNGSELSKWAFGIFKWLGEKTNNMWSVDPDMFYVGRLVFDFSFANPATAVEFALAWAGVTSVE